MRALPKARSLAWFTLAGIALANTGCLVAALGAAAAGGAAGYAYYKGKVLRDYPAEFEDTWTATQGALNDLALPLMSLEHGNGRGELGSRTADGPNVDVTVEALAGGPESRFLTRVSVRVGVFGDRHMSEQFLDQVQFRLTNPSGPSRTIHKAAEYVPAPEAPLPPQTVAPPLAEESAK
jgi:hypothetical protein